MPLNLSKNGKKEIILQNRLQIYKYKKNYKHMDINKIQILTNISIKFALNEKYKISRIKNRIKQKIQSTNIKKIRTEEHKQNTNVFIIKYIWHEMLHIRKQKTKSC